MAKDRARLSAPQARRRDQGPEQAAGYFDFVQPNVARTMVALGVNIPAGRTYSTLADALQRCVRASDAPSG